jgi:hypothetical protein
MSDQGGGIVNHAEPSAEQSTVLSIEYQLCVNILEFFFVLDPALGDPSYCAGS